MTNNSFSTEMLDVSHIPPGRTCYARAKDGAVQLCPYWKKVEDAPPYKDGFCIFLGEGDNNSSRVFWLYDQIKQCGVNL